MTAMRLTPWERERLLIFSAAELARRRRARGVPLNEPEAVALICDAMLEAARDGAAYAEVEDAGRKAVAAGDLLPGVAALLDEVRLEVLLDEGTRLVVLSDPLGVPGRESDPGAVRPAAVDASAVRGERRTLSVRNESRRVVRVSSHYPFDRVNPRLSFDRSAATGFHLDLPSGSSTRWAPGETREVTLVRYTGPAGQGEP
jgi:urease subunit gamma/beta